MIKRLPRKFKFGRVFGGILGKAGLKHKKFNLNFLGLVVLKGFTLRYEHLWSVRGVIKKWFKKRAKFKLNYGLVLPETKKPVSARMGKGKGQRSEFVSYVKRGSLFIELSGVGLLEGKKALNECSDRIPVPCKIIFLKC